MSKSDSWDETRMTVGNPVESFEDFHCQSDHCFHNKQYYPHSTNTEDHSDHQDREPLDLLGNEGANDERIYGIRAFPVLMK